MVSALSLKRGLDNAYPVTYYYFFNRTNKLRRIFHSFNFGNMVNCNFQKSLVFQVTRNCISKFKKLPCSNNYISNQSRGKFVENSYIMPTCSRTQKLKLHKKQSRNRIRFFFFFKKKYYTPQNNNKPSTHTSKQVGFLFYFPIRN